MRGGCALLVLTLALLVAGACHGETAEARQDTRRKERAGWVKLQRILRDHSMVHLTQGMSMRSKVEAMQLAKGEVRLLERGGSKRPLLEIESRDGLWARLREGRVHVRNNTLYGHPVAYSDEKLDALSDAALAALAAQHGIKRPLLKAAGGQAARREHARLMIRRATNASLPVREKLMCLGRASLSAVAQHLGMPRARRGLSRRRIVERICRGERWRRSSRAALEAATERLRREEGGGLGAGGGGDGGKRVASRAEMVGLLEWRDEVADFGSLLARLQGMVLPKLFERLVEEDTAPENVRQREGGSKLCGMVGRGAGDAWLRELGIKHGRSMVKADLVYRLMVVSHPDLTRALVDRGLVQRVEEAMGRGGAAGKAGRKARDDDRACVAAVAERVRQALCHRRCRARYHHDNSDGSWTVTSSGGHRLRVSCAVAFDRRVSKRKVSYASTVARRVERAMRGLRVPHRHVGAPCLLCDARFQGAGAVASGGRCEEGRSPSEERVYEASLKKSASVQRAWTEARHRFRATRLPKGGGDAEQGSAEAGVGPARASKRLSQVSLVSLSHIASVLGDLPVPETRSGLWTRKLAQEACRRRGVEFCDFKEWPRLKELLPRGRGRDKVHVHSRDMVCPVCPRGDGERAGRGGGGAKRIGSKKGRAKKGSGRGGEGRRRGMGRGWDTGEGEEGEVVQVRTKRAGAVPKIVEVSVGGESVGAASAVPDLADQGGDGGEEEDDYVAQARAMEEQMEALLREHDIS